MGTQRRQRHLRSRFKFQQNSCFLRQILNVHCSLNILTKQKMLTNFCVVFAISIDHSPISFKATYLYLPNDNVRYNSLT